MTLNDYQTEALALRLPSADYEYALNNLVGEVGELFSLIAKAKRDGRQPDYEERYKKELGDILWSMAVVSADMGWKFEEVAKDNITKLKDRKKRQVLQGSGDFR